MQTKIIKQLAVEHLNLGAEDLDTEVTRLSKDASPSCRALAASVLFKCCDEEGHIKEWAADLLQNLRQDKEAEVLHEAWSEFCYTKTACSRLYVYPEDDLHGI